MKRTVILAAALLLAVVSGCGKPKKAVPAAVTFSGPKGMKVQLGAEPFNKLDFKMTPGVRIFKFTAPGYAPEWKKVVVTPKDRKLEIKVDMMPWRSAVLISCSTPGGKENLEAGVKCDGVPMGVTRCLITGIAPGSHSVVCARAGYTAQTYQWVQDSPRPKPAINLELRSVIGKLLVQSEPQGATISINGKKAGVAPLALDLEAGKYEISARSENYLPVQRWVEIRSGEESSVALTLVPRPSELKLGSSPAGAVVTVNGAKCGTTPCRLENLNPGNYKIVWRKAGYDPCEKVIEVLSGSSEEVSPVLQSCSGRLKVTVRPAGVDVSVDGRPVGRTEADPVRPGETKPVCVDGLSAGSHRLVISHPRSEPSQKRIMFNIVKGKTTELPPVDLWVANCILEYTDNEPQRGALLYETGDSLMFSPAPGIKVEVKRSMLKKVTRIDVDEK